MSTAVSREVAGKVRIILVAAAVLLVASSFMPLWYTEMESPQYHGDDKIVVEVYPGRLTGNLREVETLNPYIGVHLPLDAPELRALPWVLGAFPILILGALFAPPALQRKVLRVTFVIMAAGAIAGATALQWRLYQLGHERTHSILTRVPDFTPPIVGSLQLKNFHVECGLALGGWLVALAIALTAFAWYVSGLESIRLPSLAMIRHHLHVPEIR